MVNQVVVEVVDYKEGVVDYKEGVVDYKGELVDKETILHLSYLGQVEPCSPFVHCKKYLVYRKMCHLAKPIFLVVMKIVLAKMVSFLSFYHNFKKGRHILLIPRQNSIGYKNHHQ